VDDSFRSLKDPGAEVDLYVNADLGSFARIWLGDMPFAEAVRAGKIVLTGRRDLVRRFPSWLLLSHFAEVPRPIKTSLV
jgi:putative sterol carrier protein